MTKSNHKGDKERAPKKGAATLAKVTMKALKTKKSKARPAWAIPNDNDDDDGDDEGDVGIEELGPESEDESRRGSKTTFYQKSAIVEWLNDSPNFKLMTGSASSTMKNVVAGTLLKKINAFDLLSVHVNKKCGTKWDRNTCMNRYRSYIKLYKKTRNDYTNKQGGKFSLTIEESSSGMTIEMKLDKLCSHYRSLDLLFGSRQNVQPSFVAQADDADDTDDVDSDSSDDESVVNEVKETCFVSPSCAVCNAVRPEKHFEPCGHVCMCVSCFAGLLCSMQPLTQLRCPLCREFVDEVKTYEFPIEKDEDEVNDESVPTYECEDMSDHFTDSLGRINYAGRISPMERLIDNESTTPFVSFDTLGPGLIGPLEFPLVIPPKIRKSSLKPSKPEIPAALMELTSATVTNHDDIGKIKLDASVKGKKSDFSTSYAKAKESELKFKAEQSDMDIALRREQFLESKRIGDMRIKLELDKFNSESVIREEEVLMRKRELDIKEASAKEETRRLTISTLIAQGKGKVEMEEILEMLGMLHKD